MPTDLMAGVRSFFRVTGSAFDAAKVNVAVAGGVELPPLERYAVMEAYYKNNGLYQDLARALQQLSVQTQAIRGLMNPAYRIVEFYPSVLWPGRLPEALPIIPDDTNSAIVEPIQQIWTWSNWTRKKQFYARWLALFGDVFIKVPRSENGQRVFFQIVRPEFVTDFETDERDNIVTCRIDIPISEKVGNSLMQWTHTELWSKAEQLERIWVHKEGREAEIEDLGTPSEVHDFSEWGIDFVPIVHVPFRDVGELRAAGAFTFQIDKIDQVNADATRLGQLLFRHNRPSTVFVGGQDSDGRALPPPTVITNQTTGLMERIDEDVLSVGGDTRVMSLIHNINWDAQLKKVENGMREIEDDCPELGWWRVREFGRSNDVSGRALNYILAPAIRRAIEARGNGEDGMVRAAMMALTIGAQGEPRLFSNIGTFEDGDFEHRFAEREVVPISDMEKAETDRARALAAQAWVAAGLPLEDILRRNDYPEDDIKAIVGRMEEQQAAEAEQQAAQAQQQAAFDTPDAVTQQ